MTEPSVVDAIRADLAAISDASYFQSTDFDLGGSASDVRDALSALSASAKTWPPRDPLPPYASALAYDRDLRRLRDRLEAAIAHGTIPAPEVLNATAALIDLSRGIALHLRAFRRQAARQAAA